MQKFQGLLSGPSWPCLCCKKLGPENNPYLAQIITPQNGMSFALFCFKNVLMKVLMFTMISVHSNEAFAQSHSKQQTDLYGQCVRQMLQELRQNSRFVAKNLIQGGSLSNSAGTGPVTEKDLSLQFQGLETPQILT